MSDTPIVVTENISNIAVPEVVEVVRVIEQGEQGPAGAAGESANASVGAQFPGPNLAFNTDTTVTISENDYNLYTTTNHSGGLNTYTIAAATLGPVPEGVPYYIIADYNSGTPIYRGTLNVEEVNESDVAPVFTLGLDDQGILNVEDWDTLADGKVDMGHLHQVKHQRFSSWDGLVPSVDGALHFLHTSGRMFLGWVPHTLGAFNSANAVLSPDPTETMCYEFDKDDLGAWASTLVKVYDNYNYNPVGGITALGNSKYVVLWWFRGLDTMTGGARMAYVRSENQYNTPGDALAAPIRSDLPALFASHGALVAKTVVQKGAVIADVRNLLDKSVPATPVTNHNDLAEREALLAHPASSISAVTTLWTRVLAGINGTVQAALDALDDLFFGYVEPSISIVFSSGDVSINWGVSTTANIIEIPSLTQNSTITFTGTLITLKPITLVTIPDTGGPWTLSIIANGKTLVLTRNGSGTADIETFELWSDGVDVYTIEEGGSVWGKGV